MLTQIERVLLKLGCCVLIGSKKSVKTIRSKHNAKAQGKTKKNGLLSKKFESETITPDTITPKFSAYKENGNNIDSIYLATTRYLGIRSIIIKGKHFMTE